MLRAPHTAPSPGTACPTTYCQGPTGSLAPHTHMWHGGKRLYRLRPASRAKRISEHYMAHGTDTPHLCHKLPTWKTKWLGSQICLLLARWIGCFQLWHSGKFPTAHLHCHHTTHTHLHTPPPLPHSFSRRKTQRQSPRLGRNLGFHFPPLPPHLHHAMLLPPAILWPRTPLACAPHSACLTRSPLPCLGITHWVPEA